MLKLHSQSICTGCASCASVCPKGCIDMIASDEGFLYPTVNEDFCINCDLCIKHCPTLSPQENTKRIEDIQAYAMISKDETLKAKSSSGGVFPELAMHIINNHGVVFGAALDKDVRVRHVSIESEEEIQKLQGAKYVQSSIGDSYKKAELFLKEGRWVLFSGTPCQIGGLLSYLGKEYDNLYTQDLICHGVPSPIVWEKYKSCIEAQEADKIERVSFRDKKNGWKNYSVSFKLKSGNIISKPSKNDQYMNIFLRDLCLRPSCYDCKFKTLTRQSDITLADFWGIDKLLPEMDDGKGTSLVFINSQKGKQLFSAVKDGFIYKETSPTDSITSNPSMIRSAQKPPSRDKFLNDIKTLDFNTAAKKHLKSSIWGKIKRKLSRKIKKIIQR